MSHGLPTSRAINPVVVKIPVPTTLLISTQIAVNPLMQVEFFTKPFFLEEFSVNFLSNEKPVIATDAVS